MDAIPLQSNHDLTRASVRQPGRGDLYQTMHFAPYYIIHVCISKGNVVYEVHVIIVAVELQGQTWEIYSRISSLGHIATSVVLHLFLFQSQY